MCGISGFLSLKNEKIRSLPQKLALQNKIQAHRGPDGETTWTHSESCVGFAHRRLSIIDISTGNQPMRDEYGNTIVFNGEIYNYIELKAELKSHYRFKTSSDTEIILASYKKWGEDCVTHLRGMFAFALWDEKKHLLFCARDRFGIKPFYYTVNKEREFAFASEVKTLLPFSDEVSIDYEGLKDYFVFQFPLGEKTLFKGVKQLLPAHTLTVAKGVIKTRKYWEVHYDLDFKHDKKYFQENLKQLLWESVKIHTRSDVPVGAYLSGGLDSSLVSLLGKKALEGQKDFLSFNGRFMDGPDYDETEYAREVARKGNMELFQADIREADFINNIEKVIYHLDYPVAGPGSFPQYMVSKLAGSKLKVVLGGQGGDEVFGGYTRYLLAYFEQCIKGAIDGTLNNGNFIVTYESIIPNLRSLQAYKPLMQEFWAEGLFADRDRRYFRLVNRGNALKSVINWEMLEPYSAFGTFQKIFWGENVGKESYFDSMTHFDFKTLLPALLQVEDRMSMAHGLESRVPLLDHPLIEFAATIPSNIKFENGTLKNLIKTTFRSVIPKKILDRKDKMGFPVPLSKWMKSGKTFEYIHDIFSSKKAKERSYLNKDFKIDSLISREGKFSRNLWGLLSLELWQRQFTDKATPRFK